MKFQGSSTLYIFLFYFLDFDLMHYIIKHIVFGKDSFPPCLLVVTLSVRGAVSFVWTLHNLSDFALKSNLSRIIISSVKRGSAILSTMLLWLPIENQQSLTYVVNCHFLRHPDKCKKCCHNLAFLNHLCHVWELSNEVLYDPIPQGVSKIPQVKVERSFFIK